SYVPFSVVVRRDESERAFNEYLRLKIQRRPIQTNYTITLAVVTIVVLFSATWFGFYLARGITVPIQRLAEGTRAVAHGDLDHRIEGEGEDEIGTLVTAFNRMTAELKTGRTELESRRRYLETLLANITAGVVSADAEGRVTTMNRAAGGLLGMSAAASVGRRIDEVFAGEAYADVRQLAAELRARLPAAPGLGVAHAPGAASSPPLRRAPRPRRHRVRRVHAYHHPAGRRAEGAGERVLHLRAHAGGRARAAGPEPPGRGGARPLPRGPPRDQLHVRCRARAAGARDGP